MNLLPRSAWRVVTVSVMVSIVVVLSSGRSAAAEPARESFERGLRAMKDERYTDAVEAFRVAYGASGNIDVLWNLAVAEEKAGSFVSALEHFRQYVASERGKSDRREQAENVYLPRLQAKVARILVRVPAGWVARLDQEPVGNTFRDVLPGNHVVVPGEGQPQAVISLSPGRTYEYVVVASPVGGGGKGMLAQPVPPPAARSHSAGRNVMLATLGISSLGLAAASGIFFARGVSSSETRGEIERDPNGVSCLFPSSVRCQEYLGASSDARTFTSFGIGFAVATGISLLAPGALLLLWPTDPKLPPARKD